MPKAEKLRSSDEEIPQDPADDFEGAGESPETRHQRIALAAYYRALRRGFVPDGELEDWYAAEREDDEQMEGGKMPPAGIR